MDCYCVGNQAWFLKDILVEFEFMGKAMQWFYGNREATSSASKVGLRGGLDA